MVEEAQSMPLRTNGCNGYMRNTIRRCSPPRHGQAPGHSVRPGRVAFPAGLAHRPHYITVVYLDGDPLATSAALAPLVEGRWRSGVVRPVFAGPLRTMTSWEPCHLTFPAGVVPHMMAAWRSSRSGKAAAPNFVGGRRPGQRRTGTQVFSRRCGTPGAPPLWCCPRLSHVSIDYFALAVNSSLEFDIFLLDFPATACPTSRPEPYVYSLYDDARLLVHAITAEWKLTGFRMLTHDRGSSVGMIALSMLAAQDPPIVAVLTDANIYLPLSNLTV